MSQKPMLRKRIEQVTYWSSVGVHSFVPEWFNSIFVLGYLSSGTNWLCSMLSDYYSIPVFRHWEEVTPPGAARIFHLHRFALSERAKKRTVYLQRDGRDVIISLYHKMAKTPWERRWPERFEKIVGEKMSAENIRAHLPSFIEWILTERQPASIPWHHHVRIACDQEYFRISFEDLRKDGVSALEACILAISHQSPNKEKVGKVLASNDISIKRKKENLHQVRTGMSGEWKDIFSKEAGLVFDQIAGRELIMLGYEKDTKWVELLD